MELTKTGLRVHDLTPVGERLFEHLTTIVCQDKELRDYCCNNTSNLKYVFQLVEDYFADMSDMNLKGWNDIRVPIIVEDTDDH